MDPINSRILTSEEEPGTRLSPPLVIGLFLHLGEKIAYWFSPR